MQFLRIVSLMIPGFALFFAMAAGASAQTPRKHVALEIISDRASVKPGDTVTVAVRERIEPHWHVYWVNPGDSGEPTTIDWTLPGGASAGPIQWPIPRTILIGGLTNYGYENEVLLLTDIKVPDDASGTFSVSGAVRYLVCKDICVPEEGTVKLSLPVTGESTPSSDAATIEKARRAVPKAWPGTASYGVDGSRKQLVLALAASENTDVFAGVTSARFFPLTWGIVSNADPQPVKITKDRVALTLRQGASKEAPDKFEGLVVLSKGTGVQTGYTVSASRGGNVTGAPTRASDASSGDSTIASADGVSGSSVNASGGEGPGTGLALLLAFLGGLILNLMPCVFPVLALKALSFATGRDGDHRTQGIAYLSGVLASFAGFAVVIALLREGTAALGWGFQFQLPEFVLLLAILFFVMGLSLSGVVSFGSGIMSAGDGLARKPGNAGYFFTGVLAAVAATPCTAPFMGVAIGYAMTQSPFVLLAVLLSLGLGFALPVFALSLSPPLQRLLPRPGAWMETLKQAMAFPLYATAAWLVWVLSIQTGSNGVMGAALALVGVSFAAWIASKTVWSSLPVKLIAPGVGIAALAAGLVIGGVDGSVETAPSSVSAQTIALKEEPFTKARLDALRAEGKPVFVNMTAAWCITCKVNERLALRSASIARAFDSAGIVYLKGDWTKQNPEITAILQDFGRAGVPLYLFYPGGGAEPRILPQFLTESLVLDELKTKAATTSKLTTKGV